MAKHKAYLLGDQFSEQIKHWSGGGVEGVLGNEAPNSNVQRWLSARPPLNHVLIKVLTRCDFILSWNVSKRLLVMPLIFLPSSHI